MREQEFFSFIRPEKEDAMRGQEYAWKGEMAEQGDSYSLSLRKMWVPDNEKKEWTFTKSGIRLRMDQIRPLLSALPEAILFSACFSKEIDRQAAQHIAMSLANDPSVRSVDELERVFTAKLKTKAYLPQLIRAMSKENPFFNEAAAEVFLIKNQDVIRDVGFAMLAEMIWDTEMRLYKAEEVKDMPELERQDRPVASSAAASAKKKEKWDASSSESEDETANRELDRKKRRQNEEVQSRKIADVRTAEARKILRAKRRCSGGVSDDSRSGKERIEGERKRSHDEGNDSPSKPKRRKHHDNDDDEDLERSTSPDNFERLDKRKRKNRSISPDVERKDKKRRNERTASPDDFERLDSRKRKNRSISPDAERKDKKRRNERPASPDDFERLDRRKRKNRSDSPDAERKDRKRRNECSASPDNFERLDSRKRKNRSVSPDAEKKDRKKRNDRSSSPEICKRRERRRRNERAISSDEDTDDDSKKKKMTRSSSKNPGDGNETRKKKASDCFNSDSDSEAGTVKGEPEKPKNDVFADIDDEESLRMAEQVEKDIENGIFTQRMHY